MYALLINHQQTISKSSNAMFPNLTVDLPITILYLYCILSSEGLYAWLPLRVSMDSTIMIFGVKIRLGRYCNLEIQK